MNTKSMSTQRRLQVAILGYGLLFISPQLKDSGTFVMLVAVVICLAFILLALHSSVPGKSRSSRKEGQDLTTPFTKMPLATPLTQV
jgi:hypothetical protein